jgi:hypothetical protein
MLFHVSFNYLDKRDFTLRVPSHRLDGEDDRTGRISFAETLEGCFNSMPDGASALRGMIKGATEEWKRPLFFVYMVVVSDRNKDGFVTPYELKYNHGVKDADVNREHWAVNRIPDDMIMSVIDIESAVFYESNSVLGKSKLAVKDIKYSVREFDKEQFAVMREIYRNFRERHIDFRRHGWLIDNYDRLSDIEQYEQRRIKNDVYDIAFRYDNTIFRENKHKHIDKHKNGYAAIIDELSKLNTKIDEISRKLDAAIHKEKKAP